MKMSFRMYDQYVTQYQMKGMMKSSQSKRIPQSPIVRSLQTSDMYDECFSNIMTLQTSHDAQNIMQPIINSSQQVIEVDNEH